MKFLLYFLIFCVCFFSKAQNNFEIKEGKKTVIPFQLINNLIFVPININGVNLTFMLDSGVQETILFSLEDKEVTFSQTEKVTFSGLGGDKSVEGLKSNGNNASIGENFINKDFSLYIILDQNFNISNHIGIPVNGIIGYHFFKNHPIQIDYITQKITIYNSTQEVPKKIRKYIEFPISIEASKPYILADVEMKNNNIEQKLLIDIGNSDPLWLFPTLIKDFVYNRPNIDDYLGRGFNGDVYGKRSRIHSFSLKQFKFEKPLIAMPDEFSIQHVKMVKDRKGSIGGEIMRRFLVVFDYPNQKIYLKKNKNFNDPFSFNMSGIDFKQEGMVWSEERITVSEKENSAIKGQNIDISPGFQYKFVLKPNFLVSGVRKDSPAYIAGIKAEDAIVSINDIKVTEFTMSKIQNMMKSEDGKKINMVINRNGMEIKFSFYLEDPIPYEEK
jgi:hypothetical protein